MTYLLDTCIISALRKIKAHPQPKLLAWFENNPETEYYICSVTIGEIERGISKLPSENPAKMMIDNWFHGQLLPQFSGRILNFDKESAIRWGRITAENEKRGRTLPILDGQIAAIADAHNLIVVTFNVMDFQGLVQIINPLLV